MINVKVIPWWTTPSQFLYYNSKLTKGDNTWNDIKLVDTTYADYYVFINGPNESHDEYYDISKSIIIQMEPSSTLARYDHWYSEIVDKVFYFFDTKTHHNGIEWHISKSYTWLMNNQIAKSKTMSSIISDEYQLEGHRKRVNFIKYLHDEDFFEDLYGKFSQNGTGTEIMRRLHKHRGSLPYYMKDAGLFPYKYTFNAENTSENGYFTEKIVDAILSECLCFYWGCPNLESFIDGRAFIRLDLDNIEGSIKFIRDSINNNEYEKRIDIIRVEKKKILNELQLLPTIEGIIKNMVK